MKKFGLNKVKDFNKDLLTQEDYNKLKELKSNDDIIIKKADKSNIFVILNKEDYSRKLNDILSDNTKFKPIDIDPTEDIKKRLNGIIKHTNSVQIDDNKIFQNAVGHFSPGYIYGNPKIHKNISNPPLRPIISTMPTPCYEISKMINNLIRPYMPRTHSVDSTSEFIGIIKSSKPLDIVASLDVVSLFTNVPLRDTIDIILEQVYRNPELPPINVPEEDLK